VILRKKIDKSKNLKFTPYIVRDCDILIDGDIRLRDIGIPLDGKIIADGAKRIYPVHGNPFSVQKLKATLRKSKAENMVSYRK